MTQGPVRGHLLRMAAFMLTGMLLQMLFGLVDIWFASRLGPQAAAAVSVAGNLMYVVMALTQMLTVGTVAVISHAAGRREHAQVQYAFNQSLGLSLASGAAFLVLGLGLQEAYIGALIADAHTAQLAREFLFWFVPSLALQFAITGVVASLRGIGSVKPGMVAQSLAVLLNMALAPVLMFGWGTGVALGVAGAGLATFIATLAAVAGLGLYLGRRETWLRVRLPAWRPDGALWLRMLGIGAPAGGEFLVMACIMSLIYAVIGVFGPGAQAGFGIGLRIMQVGFMPAIALSFAAAAVAGQNFGAGRAERVRETFVESVRLSVACMLAFAALCHLLPETMMRGFSDEGLVVETGAGYLRYISWNFVASGVISVAAGMLQGMGNTLPSLVASATRLLTFVVPVAWLVRQPDFAIAQVWTLSVVSVWVQALVVLWLLRRAFGRRLGDPLPAAVAA